MISKQKVATTLLLTAIGEVNGIGRSLADCESVASQFDNTCASTSTPIDFASHVGEAVTCTDSTWNRKLCVTCSEQGEHVYIRVQSNSLPNHCIYSSSNSPVETETDWKVQFNQNVTGQAYYPDSEKEVDTSLGITGCSTKTTDDETIEKKRHVLVVGIDGARSDVLTAADTPTFDNLKKNGMSTMEAMT